MSRKTCWAVGAVLVLGAVAWGQQSAGVAEGTRGVYAVLTAEWDAPPPVQEVIVTYGPRERDRVWWQLEVKKEKGVSPLLVLRGLTDRDPMAEAGEAGFERYVLKIPETGQVLEYRDVHSGKALLPGWKDFGKWFVPGAGKGSLREAGMPQTLAYLGHTLTLLRVEKGRAWEKWEGVKQLDLDRELLVGTGRNFRDVEGKRLPQTPNRQNYTYVPFVKEEYPVMMKAGINLFLVSPEQEAWVRDEPVFYLRGAGGKTPLKYPVDLYRSNYIGSVMFMDEPAILLVGDKNVHTTLRYFSDATNLLEQRVRGRYRNTGSYGAFELENALKKMGVHFGEMRLEQWDYPAWETMYETAYYQLAAGVAGIVHEGRYRLEDFDKVVAKWTDKARKHTPEEMLWYHYAFLRGAAGQTGRHWGTSIYGQAEEKHSPLAVTMAYDMGARYVWFWTSDHDHHMPWVEQLELARVLKEHGGKKPRGSIYGKRPVVDVGIVMPYGWLVELGDLWWVRAIDKEGKSAYGQRYGRLMRRVHEEIQRAMDGRESFDIVVDDGRPVDGYKRMVRVSEQ